LGVRERHSFDAAVAPIEQMIATGLSPNSRGLAVFSRAGEEPFLLPLQFQVPLPNWIVLDSTPNIYHLVELKDTYHRYVLMIVTEETMRVLQVNLGAITSQVQEKLPRHLQRQLIDIVPVSGGTPLSDVVDATLSSFMEAEEQESRTAVANLVHQLRTGGLAVGGAGPTLQALYCGRY